MNISGASATTYVSALCTRALLALTLTIAATCVVACRADVLLAQSTAKSDSASAGDDDLINADRPGIADGSRVVQPGQLQLEVGLQHENRTEDGTREVTIFAPTLIRLGLTDHIEARIESNSLTHDRLTDAQGTVARSTGLAPVLLGGKWTFYDSGGDARRSLGTIVRIAPPSGSSDFRTDRVTGDIRLAADWDFAPELSLNPNIGATLLEGSEGQAFGAALGALTLTYQPTPRLSPFIDAGYQSLEDPGGTWSLVLDAGVAYIIGRDLQLDVSAGRGVHGDTPPRPFIAAGISVRARAFRHSGSAAARRAGP